MITLHWGVIAAIVIAVMLATYIVVDAIDYTNGYEAGVAHGRQAELGRIVLNLAKSKSCPDALGLPNDCSDRQSDCKCLRCWYRALRNIQNEDTVQQ